MTHVNELSDADLVRFLDGQMSKAESRSIRSRIDRDSSLSERIDQLSFSIPSLRSSMDALLTEAPKFPFGPTVQRPSERIDWTFGALAAGVAGIAFGAALTALAFYEPDEQWTDHVAVYQMLYVEETVAALNLEPAVLEQQIQSVGAALGVDLNHLSDLPHLEFRRAQLLGFEGRAIAQLVYVDEVGRPVALCVIETSPSDDIDLGSSVMRGLAANTWTEGGYGYLLIGRQDTEMLEEIRLSANAL